MVQWSIMEQRDGTAVTYPPLRVPLTLAKERGPQFAKNH
jgi:hypothetical protein